MDHDGNPTKDPGMALKAIMMPMGGLKGSAFSIMMDVFSGVLSGSAFAGVVTNPYGSSRPADVGHFLIAIKPYLFMSAEDFRERMNRLCENVVRSERGTGMERIYFLGEIEHLTQGRRIITEYPPGSWKWMP